MHPTLVSIKSELKQLSDTLLSVIPSNEPFNVAHGNWAFPGLTRDELILISNKLADLIDNRGGDDLQNEEILLADYVRRISFLKTHTVPQIWGSNCALAVASFVSTMEALEKVLNAEFTSEINVANDTGRTLLLLRKRLQAIDKHISSIEPRSNDLMKMVDRIESAHDAADQMSEDLSTLRETREIVANLLKSSTKDQGLIADALSSLDNKNTLMNSSALEAEAILKRCDDAYRATASEGLASAFSERSRSIALSMWVWVVGLLVALITGGLLGSRQLQSLSNQLNITHAQDNNAIWVNLILALLSIGGSVWFAWVATKQIGQRFRLAEDYGYKASISKAYEGYRREAEKFARTDPDFQSRLFSSALTRLEELPLRLVETQTHGSPWHELMSSDIVAQALKTGNGFIENVRALANATVSTAQKKMPEPAKEGSE